MLCETPPVVFNKALQQECNTRRGAHRASVQSVRRPDGSWRTENTLRIRPSEVSSQHWASERCGIDGGGPFQHPAGRMALPESKHADRWGYPWRPVCVRSLDRLRQTALSQSVSNSFPASLIFLAAGLVFLQAGSLRTMTMWTVANCHPSRMESRLNVIRTIGFLRHVWPAMNP